MPQPGQPVCRCYYRVAALPPVSPIVIFAVAVYLSLLFLFVIPEGDLLLLLPLLFSYVVILTLERSEGEEPPHFRGAKRPECLLTPPKQNRH